MSTRFRRPTGFSSESPGRATPLPFPKSSACPKTSLRRHADAFPTKRNPSRMSWRILKRSARKWRTSAWKSRKKRMTPKSSASNLRKRKSSFPRKNPTSSSSLPPKQSASCRKQRIMPTAPSAGTRRTEPALRCGKWKKCAGTSARRSSPSIRISGRKHRSALPVPFVPAT